MSTEDTKEKAPLWTRMKTRWRLWGPWRRTFILLDVVLILNLLFMLGAWILHPLIIIVPPGGIETHLALVSRFPFQFVPVLAIIGSAFSAVVTPMDMFPDKRFRVIALFLISWMGTITTLVCLFFQNQWYLVMSPITGLVPIEPYPGYWAQMGLQNVIYNHLTLLPLLMVLGFFGMIIAYLFQYWILG
ncbi:MAG: hypothetical protein ACFFCF_08805 [Promethearchaeota archaeon]